MLTLALTPTDVFVIKLLIGVPLGILLLAAAIYWVVARGSPRANSLLSSCTWGFIFGFAGWAIGLVLHDLHRWGWSAVIGGVIFLLYYVGQMSEAADMDSPNPVHPQRKPLVVLAVALWIGSAVGFGLFTAKKGSPHWPPAIAGAVLAFAGGVAFSYSRDLPSKAP